MTRATVRKTPAADRVDLDAIVPLNRSTMGAPPRVVRRRTVGPSVACPTGVNRCAFARARVALRRRPRRNNWSVGDAWIEEQRAATRGPG